MHFEVQNPVHLFILILILFLLLADILDTYGIFLLRMQLFEGSGAFFMQSAYNLKKKLILFRARFWFQEIGVVFLLKCQYA